METNETDLLVIAEVGEDDRKLFVGGKAGEEDMNGHFSQFGEIERLVYKRGRMTRVFIFTFQSGIT